MDEGIKTRSDGRNYGIAQHASQVRSSISFQFLFGRTSNHHANNECSKSKVRHTKKTFAIFVLFRLAVEVAKKSKLLNAGVIANAKR